MLSLVICASDIGTRSSPRICPVVRCVSGSKVRIDSSVSPKKSRRIGAGIPGGKRSTMPPRTANSPVSRTVEVRKYPFMSSQRASCSVSTMLPGAAEKLSEATFEKAGTRCSAALTVVSSRRGLSPDLVLASRDSVVIRCATMEGAGETRS